MEKRINVSEFPKKERRRVVQRLIWVAPEAHSVSPHTLRVAERRMDTDAIVVIREIQRSVVRREAVGMVFGLMKANGRIEYGLTGFCYDNPLVAAGIASRIQALTDGWPQHPMGFVPGDSDSEVD